jgi:hypothetical protein
MKVIVITDEKGDIESVAGVTAELDGQVHVEKEDGGTVHTLELDDEAVSEKSLRGSQGDEARKKALGVLKDRIRREAPPSSGR